MHKLREIAHEVNKTHHGLGPLVATEILTAKAKKTLLKVAPAGCGKSAVSDSISEALFGNNLKLTSITLAGLIRLKTTLTDYEGHVIIDDMGAEKSQWSRISTITCLANLVHTHYVRKVTHGYELILNNFNGSVSLNIQPVLLNSLIQTDDWVAVVRDKVLRYYHLFRPKEPKQEYPHVDVDEGVSIDVVEMNPTKGKLWYQLVAIGLTQWSYARVNEHIPDLLKAAASLDGRKKVNVTDYYVLIKLLQVMQIEPYIVRTFGFETGRVFNNNLYCILVEIASFGEPTMEQICVDYKVSRTTAEKLIAQEHEWCWVKNNSPRKVMPTDKTKDLLDLAGVNQRW